LEDFAQFAYLASESQDEIFGGVELLPVAIISETLRDAASFVMSTSGADELSESLTGLSLGYQ